MKLYIGNMACDCCSELIKKMLDDLEIPYKHVDLGETELAGELSPQKYAQLVQELSSVGFELLDDKKAILVEKIKAAVEEFIMNPLPGKRFSDRLSKKLGYDYNYLSTLFSAVQVTTIEQYLIGKRVDQAKYMILFEESTIAEIADKLGYSSPAHLSGQFKKITGLTPTHFKELRNKRNEYKNRK